MIIVLKNADFSANNIGKITIPRDPSQEALAMLANYTRSLTDEQVLAFDDFQQGLKDAGIWAKITHLYMPILAGQLSEICVNLVDENFASDLTLGTDAATYLTLNSKGVKNTNTANNWAAGFYTEITEKVNNFHILTFPTNAASETLDFMGLGENAGKTIFPPYIEVVPQTNKTRFGYWLQSSALYNYNGQGASAGTYDAVIKIFDDAQVVPTNLYGVSITPAMVTEDASLTRCVLDGELLSCTNAERQTNVNYYPDVAFGNIYLTGRRSQYLHKEHGMFSIGVGLTATEVATYNTLAKEFMTAMGIE